MIKKNTSFGCECWTDGKIIGVHKDNKKEIEYILELLEGKLVSGWKKKAEEDFSSKIVDIVRNNLVFVKDQSYQRFKQYQLRPFLHLLGWGCQIVTPKGEYFKHFYNMSTNVNSYYFACKNINNKKNLKILADYEYYYAPNFNSDKVKDILSLIKKKIRQIFYCSFTYFLSFGK